MKFSQWIKFVKWQNQRESWESSNWCQKLIDGANVNQHKWIAEWEWEWVIKLHIKNVKHFWVIKSKLTPEENNEIFNWLVVRAETAKWWMVLLNWRKLRANFIQLMNGLIGNNEFSIKKGKSLQKEMKKMWKKFFNLKIPLSDDGSHWACYLMRLQSI